MAEVADTTEPVKVKSEGTAKEGKPGGILHQFGKLPPVGGGKAVLVLGVVLIVLAGIGTGYFLSSSRVGPAGEKREMLGGGVEKVVGAKRVGIDDPEAFRDSAEGVVEINEGEFTTEGSHKLIRPGGESQTAYLTSSVVDLDQFVGKKVKVWGETFVGQKAGWFMDVGLVEVLE